MTAEYRRRTWRLKIVVSQSRPILFYVFSCLRPFVPRIVAIKIFIEFEHPSGIVCSRYGRGTSGYVRVGVRVCRPLSL
jgi:hypothetical protein